MPLPKDDEGIIRNEVIRMASTSGRYAYRIIPGIMRNSGWGPGHDKQSGAHLATRRSTNQANAAP